MLVLNAVASHANPSFCTQSCDATRGTLQTTFLLCHWLLRRLHVGSMRGRLRGWRREKGPASSVCFLFLSASLQQWPLSLGMTVPLQFCLYFLKTDSSCPPLTRYVHISLASWHYFLCMSFTRSLLSNLCQFYVAMILTSSLSPLGF